MRRFFACIISFALIFVSVPVFAADTSDYVTKDLGTIQYSVPSSWYQAVLDSESTVMYYCNDSITYITTLMYLDWGLSDASSLLMSSGIVADRAKPGTSTIQDFEINGRPFKYAQQVTTISDTEYLEISYILPVGDGENVIVTLYMQDGSSMDLNAVMGFHDLCTSIVLEDGTELGDVVSIALED